MKQFNAIEQSLQISAPSWPLQNSVAVNPFWFLRHKTFFKVITELEPVLRTSLYMPSAYYEEALNSGTITHSALEESMRINSDLFTEKYSSIEDFMKSAMSEGSANPGHQTLSEFFSNHRDFRAAIIMDLGKYASAYLDEKQAISAFPWTSDTFWNAWLKAQKLDRSMEFYGLKNFRKSLVSLEGLDAEGAIQLMLKSMGIANEQRQINYMKSLLASVLGWSSQFKYVEWQKQLGYSVSSSAAPVDLLAVRMAYDYGVYSFHSDSKKVLENLWLDKPNKIKNSPRYLKVLQFALELSFQKKLASTLKKNASKDQSNAIAQILFCIDVRSEMIRRNIEGINSAITTIGFAGFFGVPFDYKSPAESKPSHRLPVLLSPAFQVEEVAKQNNQSTEFSSVVQQVSSYFRNLRKNPLSSFLYVELFGALYIEKALRRSFLSVAEKIKGKQIPVRFKSHGYEPSQSAVVSSNGSPFDTTQKIERAEAVLKHMGLVNSFAKIVLILGHGSVTTNNAFGSSLDCGACGGHAGDINARFLADLLNEPAVRKGLVEKGIAIPSSTQFIAGVHETVSDQIFILENEKVKPELQFELSSLERDLELASTKARNERLLSKPVAIDPNAEVRSKNWSEVRPEWGLVGNACFIVAPRSRTIGLNLDSRSFLHDYDWKLDQAQKYMTLELIMTAPMVVTNWINLQYFASTVAPTVFGSGNKVLHNLVNETGVYEGNGGDLRVGLPIQSVHDGKKFVHEPLRLSVFIEAPRDQIESLITKHEVVRQLVDNEWLHLIHIDPASLQCERRTAGGKYVPV
ncbi:MAG: DUF2309 domain-containing protein [Cryobacterium sp.]|nr:DUF2309 domain-containing protein [Oligoflexia bacterium]